MKRTLMMLMTMTACMMSASVTACPELLKHKFVSLQGDTVDLCAFEKRPILVVNTASKCGYTPQLEKLEALHKRYGARGLVVLGFPSNDFNQEYASNKEIASFCRLNYAIEFPMMEQGAVSGPKAGALFRQLAAASGQAPAWNFHKYLIAPDGKTVYSFRTQTEPDAAEILVRLTPMLR